MLMSRGPLPDSLRLFSETRRRFAFFPLLSCGAARKVNKVDECDAEGQGDTDTATPAESDTLLAFFFWNGTQIANVREPS